jgi:hypothetical protein
MSQAKVTPEKIKLTPRDEDVEELVQEILRDRSINISVIPDSLESAIYKSTIQLTLDAIYGMIQDMFDGKAFLEHEIRLVIQRQSEEERLEKSLETTTCWNHKSPSFCCGRRSTPKSSFLITSPSGQLSSDINDEVLEEVASRLLENKTVNQRFLPDPIEHAIYANCLKVIFRILDIMTTSLRVSVCGHDIGLNLEPTAWQVLQRHVGPTNREQNAHHSCVSKIKEEKLRDLSRPKADQISQQELGFWDSLRFPRDFVVNLQASIYGLLLGILDDMLEHTKIDIFSDQISLNVVPMQQENKRGETIVTPTTEKNTGHNVPNCCDPNDAKKVHLRKEICRNMESIGFEHERRIIMSRFEAMTPEQRAILRKDLNLEGQK